MGFQIALTGCVVCAVVLGIIKYDGRDAEQVSMWVVAPVTITGLIGVAAIVVGSLMGIWGY